ncbi:post-transcriptional regulator [Paenibacillus hunanensis]|uniref:post-transcriptional regulator n=1 Tax=Paenibacillus hunanensis TaxID=539262 RepID=UPI002A6A7A0C|nr:post-transcriptional regulator [Paenibacillus hunanensis]WPP43585.1 post-transcriptional regulator [Paenibacillus hunanensis]
MDELSNAELTELIESLCQSKIEEFKLLGYEQITSEELWDCLNSKYSKQGMPRLYELVNDILSMKPNQLMHYLTMSSYKEADIR